jgi:hypothetical protein
VDFGLTQKAATAPIRKALNISRGIVGPSVRRAHGLFFGSANRGRDKQSTSFLIAFSR